MRENTAGLLGRAPAIERLREQIAQLGPSDLSVHVFGETGTGKERVARALHAASGRARGPFVAFNAAGFGDELVLAELFGHARGAFTGAVVTREGYVAAAERGTLLIDEVAEMTLVAQAKLLRFLQEREYQRLGETAPRRADVRVLSATNADIPRLVGEGRFRKDLWYRLSDERLVVPPLRERGEDVLLLAHHFLGREARRLGRPSPCLSQEAEKALLAFAWPGNVRQLESEMRRLAVVACGGLVCRADLSRELRESTLVVGDAPLRAAIQAFERERVLEALLRHDGCLARAAGDLGITRQALWAKVRRLGLQVDVSGRTGARPPEGPATTAWGMEAATHGDQPGGNLERRRRRAGPAEQEPRTPA
jgi:DNA-binding NtrC family response regulator